MELRKIEYSSLNARQKENYNFQKISAVLADYGLVTIRLSDDWNGADFLALDINGEVLRVQLKARFAFARKYIGKEIWIACPHGGHWYLYNHDEILSVILENTSMGTTESWLIQGEYSFKNFRKNVFSYLEKYCITVNEVRR